MTCFCGVMFFFLFYRPNFNNQHKPTFPKKNHYVNTKLEVRKIPRELNNITKLNEHFSKFGTIVNIQVCILYRLAWISTAYHFMLRTLSEKDSFLINVCHCGHVMLLIT